MVNRNKDETLIKIRKVTAKKLKKLAISKRESYDEIINRTTLNKKEVN